MDDDIVDAHGYKVDADRIVPVRHERNLEFRTNTIRSAHQDRLPVFPHIKPEERTVLVLTGSGLKATQKIGEILGVSESRVCQLHSQAVARLRSMLKGY